MFYREYLIYHLILFFKKLFRPMLVAINALFGRYMRQLFHVGSGNITHQWNSCMTVVMDGMWNSLLGMLINIDIALVVTLTSALAICKVHRGHSHGIELVRCLFHEYLFKTCPPSSIQTRIHLLHDRMDREKFVVTTCLYGPNER